MSRASNGGRSRVPVPRDREDDYSEQAVRRRLDFARERCGAELEHVSKYSFDPAMLSGNIEHFIGVAQAPIGLAGPLLVNGEHAQGEFYVPMATAEGTLVASYNRGMRLLYEAGGVTATVIDDRMQRACLYVRLRARSARVRAVADRSLRGDPCRGGEHHAVRQAPGHRAVLGEPNPLYALQLHHRRRGWAEPDGQGNQEACRWITANYDDIEHYFLESNFATDKKSSQVNMLRTRGKRVVAEATISNELFERIMRANTDLMFRARQVSNLGGFMSGVHNNGAHSANGVTAMFIATGQDVANVAESSAAFVYAERHENGDYYFSVTIPSLIVATYGGGTGLATQRECLELLDCYGKDKVRKFTEIVAATVLCGELSLGSAIVAEEWVAAHDIYGRNRPTGDQS